MQATFVDSAFNEDAECENKYVILIHEYSFLGSAITKSNAIHTEQLIFSLCIDEESKG